MSVLYLLTSSEPPIEGTDATFQEVSALKAAFNGEMLNLCPRRVPGRPFPPQLLGLHKLPRIWQVERHCTINHVFHSIPFRFPVLRFLRKPVVYTVLTSVPEIEPPDIGWLSSLHSIVVSNPRDAAILQSWGLANHAVVSPAVDTDRIAQGTLQLRNEITLLMASAPWVEDQFESKGIDALLNATVQLPELRLILLWRGLLLGELLERVERRGLKGRVEIISERVDVNKYLRRVHATVLPAKRSDIVKAYPHSLLESLLAGKPVILSDALPMADYVRQHGCGIVLNEVSGSTLIEAIKDLQARYDALAQRARLIDLRAFSQKTMIESYRVIYGLKPETASKAKF